MKRFSLWLAAICLSASAVANNIITIDSVCGAPQTEAVVTVSLDNAEPVRALEIFIPLPEDLNFVDGSCVLSSRSNGHRISAAQLGRELRIYIYGLTTNSILGNSGTLFTMRLRLGSNPGSYDLSPTVLLGNSSGNALPCEVVPGNVTIQAPQIKLITPTIDFGRVPIRASYTRNIQLKNTGNAPLVISNIISSDALFVPEKTQLTIPPQETASIPLYYAPTQRGATSQTLRILSNAVNGTQDIILLAEPFSVNELHVGSATGIADSVVTITISMNNMEPIVAMQCAFKLPKQLEYVSNSLKINPARSNGHGPISTVRGDTLFLMFYSLSNKAVLGNDGDIATFQLRLNGTSGTYYLNPIDVVLGTIYEENMLSDAFQGSVKILAPKINCAETLFIEGISVSEPATAELSVRNTGSAPLVIDRITFFEEGYTIVEPLPIIIPANQTMPITVAYQPKQEGEFATTMNIYSNDPNNRLKTVAITGRIRIPNALAVQGQFNDDGTYTLSVALDNLSAITAIQYDLHWRPEMTTSQSAFQPTSRISKHSYAVAALDEDTYRVIIYSLSNAPVQGNSGEVHQLVFSHQGDVDCCGDIIKIDNIILGNSSAADKVSQTSLTCSVQHTKYTRDTVIACDEYIWNKRVYTASGTYTDTLTSLAGCDSIVSLYLMMNNSSTTSFTVSSYEEYTWKGTTYTESGVYYDSMQTVLGCDSIEILHLTIEESNEPPSVPGDYRVVYIERENASSPYTKFHVAHYIPQSTSTPEEQLVSVFVNKQSGKNPAILLQQCIDNAGDLAWQTIDTNPIGNYTSITMNGVYDFVVQLTSSSANILNTIASPYQGNYYIRTDCANGGWEKYREDVDNLMTHSEEAFTHGGYDYYKCKHVSQTGINVKYTIANDHSAAISDTLAIDNIATLSILPAPADLRFTWNSTTNQLQRAYLNPSTLPSERSLMLVGNKYLYDTNINLFANNECALDKLNEWQYQLDIAANTNTKVQLTAQYHNSVQYFYGQLDQPQVLISGTSRNYKMRLIYDFRTNRLITAIIGDQNVIDNLSVSEVMIFREHHDPAKILNFGQGRSIKNVNTAYSVMTLYKDQLNDSSLPELQRALYWVSFPFDVKLTEVFGAGNYGEHWIMEYYDGHERAQNGGWADVTYWRYITDPTDVILHAGVGYVLALDLSLFGLDSDVYAGKDHVNLYFPSNPNYGMISVAPTIVNAEIPTHTCEINRPTADGDRRIKDSNWNIVGVPSFINPSRFVAKQGDLKFYYHWDASTDTYDVQLASSFQTMHAYMVQFAGTIDWGNKIITPADIAARKQRAEKDQYTLCLVLQKDDNYLDQTFIQLDYEGATVDFDLNLDLCKIFNTNANIYSVIGDNIEVAANVLPMQVTTVPIQVKISSDGVYTMAMPDGTDGINAVLVDYETGVQTNLLLSDYTVHLGAGAHTNRFALILNPQQTATSIDDFSVHGAQDDIQKYMIDGRLFIHSNGNIYDAQGRKIL